MFRRVPKELFYGSKSLLVKRIWSRRTGVEAWPSTSPDGLKGSSPALGERCQSRTGKATRQAERVFNRVALTPIQGAAYPIFNGSCLHLGSEHLGGFHLQTEEFFVRTRVQCLPFKPTAVRPDGRGGAVSTRGSPKLNEEEH